MWLLQRLENHVSIAYHLHPLLLQLYFTSACMQATLSRTMQSESHPVESGLSPLTAGRRQSRARKILNLLFTQTLLNRGLSTDELEHVILHQ